MQIICCRDKINEDLNLSTEGLISLLICEYRNWDRDSLCAIIKQLTPKEVLFLPVYRSWRGNSAISVQGKEGSGRCLLFQRQFLFRSSEGWLRFRNRTSYPFIAQTRCRLSVRTNACQRSLLIYKIIKKRLILPHQPLRRVFAFRYALSWNRKFISKLKESSLLRNRKSF